MRRFLHVLFLIICYSAVSGQELIRGIINDYTAANGYTCSNALLVDDASAFSAGDKILIVQMKGALINESNSSSFGNVTDYGTTGKYEINEVAFSETGVLYLNYIISHDYDYSAFVQVVRIPVYADAIIDSTLTCKSWDGNTGGILVFFVEGTLTLQADIDASEKGFRGGDIENYPDSCPFGFAWTGYRTGIDSGNGAVKGEGFATVTDEKRAGRGKLANGGGGGNDHNAGGGGGSMGGSGGVGGERVASTFSCPGPGVGQSGFLPDNSNGENRIYLGGGGGAGHGNNGYSKAGGNGGGIILLSAITLDGNGYSIKSNGTSRESVLGDGGSGGGAAGTLLLDISTLGSEVLIELKGGNGSDITGDGCTGPGGGGGGGLIRFTGSSLPIGIFSDLSGGIAGTTLTEASDCYGDSNGATDGSYGEIIYDWPMLISSEIFINDFAMVNNDTTICLGDTITLEASGGVIYNWSPATWLSASDISNPLCFAENSITYTVVVTNAAGCYDTAEVTVTVFPEVNAIAGPDTTVCGANQIQFFASGGDDFLWSPSTGVSNIYIANPIVFVTESIDYYVTVSNGVCNAIDTVSIIVNPLPDIITNNDTTICLGESIVLSASGASTYLWEPASSVPCMDCTYMEVTPTTTTEFTVTGTNTDGCMASESIIVTVEICQAISNASTINYSIYPNPADAFFIIQFDDVITESIDFNLFAADNKLVYHSELSVGEKQFKISTAALPSGIYFYKMQNDLMYFNGKLIVE